MLLQWDREQPGRVENIARSIGHLAPSHLADHQLFDFMNLTVDSKDSAQIPLTQLSV